MTGALWALFAGVGFGVFQTINRRSVKGMDVFVSTFLQLLISALVLGLLAVLTQDLSRLQNAPIESSVSFMLAGLLHFALGWTFLNASQKRIGAARTGALIGTTPMFAAIIAFFTLGEGLGPVSLLGIALITAGAFVTNNPFKRRTLARDNTTQSDAWVSLLLALGAPLCWSISPIFIRQGLVGLDSPLLGVTIGITANVVGYALALAVRHVRSPLGAIPSEALTLKIIAGILVGLSTWMRWVALDLAAVALVLAISLVSVPTVNLLTPLVIDRQLEEVTRAVWIGAALIIAGSLLLILT